MRTRISVAAVAALLPVAVFAQLPSYEPKYGNSGIDLGAMDTNVSPCSNFYQYACGTWRVKNPIPPDRARWSRFDELSEKNFGIGAGHLEKAAQPSPTRSVLDQKIGDFYAACINEPAIERVGIAPIEPELNQIDGLRSKKQLAAVLANLGGAGINGMFGFFADADSMDASRNIANIDQGGLSLPDRDYYIKTDAASIDIRTKFQQHVARVFGLLAKARNAQWDSNARAAAVLKFETALAPNSMDRVARRNPDARNHPMTAEDLPGLIPDFQWNVFFTGEAAPAFQKVNVGNPEFRKLGDLLKQDSDWREGNPAQVEALRGRNRLGVGRGSRPEVCGGCVQRSRESQGS
jgi:putative endopeptidase